MSDIASKGTFSTSKFYVRSQVQLAEDTSAATGHRLLRDEAIRLFGKALVDRVDEDGAAPLISSPKEPAATLKNRRMALGLSAEQVARRAGVDLATMNKAEKIGSVSPIRFLERIAQALALDEQLLGYEGGANGDEALGVRLREFTERQDTRRFSASDVLSLTEAAWVIRKQNYLATLLKNVTSASDYGFVPDADYSYPAFEKGYKLAALTRRNLEIDETAPILSVRSLIEDRLNIPVVQQAMAQKFAGATLADGRERGIVINEAGQNSNVWVRRMTMAHELGHLLWDPDERLNTLRVDKYDDVGAHYRDRVVDPVEIRTNAFAISLLAPPGGVKELVNGNSTLTEAVSSVMRTYGIGGTAAKYHVKNVCELDTSSVSMGDLPAASDDWIGRENLTVDWFPLKTTPISRRGRFALLTAESFKHNLISADTAAMYLKCTGEEARDRADDIAGAFS